jgi:hypothetical protein
MMLCSSVVAESMPCLIRLARSMAYGHGCYAVFRGLVTHGSPLCQSELVGEPKVLVVITQDSNSKTFQPATPPCHSELAEEPKVLVAALPRDPAEYRRTESVTIGPKPRTRKMIGMISGRTWR